MSGFRTVLNAFFGSLLLIATPAGAAFAQIDGRYYSETGHSLDEFFEPFYDTHGGSEVLGFPITESFVDPYSGFLVQYFENARLELAADPQAEELKVRVADLGVLLGGWDLPLPANRFPIGRSPGCRYYAQSGHQVCHSFLDFYEARGGPAVFGYPITEFRIENGRMVQYFQDLRLDWYPEAEEGDYIRVGPLGRAHFDFMGYSQELLTPIIPGDLAEYSVLELQLSASVLRPLLGAGESQRAYLVVSDQNHRPVEGAAALLTVYLPEGVQFKMLPLTDRNGVAQTELILDGQLPGTRVPLEYTVIYEGLFALTRDSFYIWW
ncbi:MAG: hypothetical protein AABY97_05070 [Chloroflexota bacterium]